MHTKIFISYTSFDKKYAGRLIEEMREHDIHYEVAQMETKKPWDDEWKKETTDKIKECSAAVVLVGSKTHIAVDARFEMQMLNENGVQLMGLRVGNEDGRKIALPPELNGKKVVDWEWNSIDIFLRTLRS